LIRISKTLMFLFALFWIVGSTPYLGSALISLHGHHHLFIKQEGGNLKFVILHDDGVNADHHHTLPAKHDHSKSERSDHKDSDHESPGDFNHVVSLSTAALNPAYPTLVHTAKLLPTLALCTKLFSIVQIISDEPTKRYQQSVDSILLSSDSLRTRVLLI